MVLAIPHTKKDDKNTEAIKIEDTISMYNSRKPMNPEFGQPKQNTLPAQVYWTETHTY